MILKFLENILWPFKKSFYYKLKFLWKTCLLVFIIRLWKLSKFQKNPKRKTVVYILFFCIIKFNSTIPLTFLKKVQINATNLLFLRALYLSKFGIVYNGISVNKIPTLLKNAILIKHTLEPISLLIFTFYLAL